MPAYYSPELKNNNIYSKANDIWACGLMLMIMSSGMMLSGYYDILRKNNHNFNFLNLDNDGKHLLRCLTRLNINKRYSAQKALKHKFFDNINEICPVVKKYLNTNMNLNICNFDDYWLTNNVDKSNGWFNNNLKLDNIFKNKRLTYLNEKMWFILIDWLCEVAILYHYSLVIIEHTCYYINKYLSYININKSNFQLIGCCAMQIACMYLNNYYNESKDFVFISNNTFNLEKFEENLNKMIIILDFDLDFEDNISDKILKLNLNYNDNIIKIIDILGALSYTKYNFFLMDQDIRKNTILNIVDRLNEIITGKINYKVRKSKIDKSLLLYFLNSQSSFYYKIKSFNEKNNINEILKSLSNNKVNESDKLIKLYLYRDNIDLKNISISKIVHEIIFEIYWNKKI